MIYLQASFPCSQPGRLILKLCKHFRHKVPAEFSAERGEVDFQPGRCSMRAEVESLLFLVEGEDEQATGRIQYILLDHVRRMERRPDLELAWAAGVVPAAAE